jgi:hypothetical protein
MWNWGIFGGSKRRRPPCQCAFCERTPFNSEIERCRFLNTQAEVSENFTMFYRKHHYIFTKTSLYFSENITMFLRKYHYVFQICPVVFFDLSGWSLPAARDVFPFSQNVPENLLLTAASSRSERQINADEGDFWIIRSSHLPLSVFIRGELSLFRHSISGSFRSGRASRRV